MRPSRFVIVAASLLALLHAYIGYQLLPDLPIGLAGRIGGALWLALSWLLIPIGLMMSRSIKQQPLADRLAWAGMLMMGLFSSLLVLTFLRDIALLLAGFFMPTSLAAVVVPWSAIAVVALAVLATLIGLVNARRRAQVVNVDVPIIGLPAELNGFTIAQLSDIHVGATIKRGYLDAIVDTVNGLHADVVAITGDLIDGSVQQLAPHTAPLARLEARHGTYFVTGNHEYYSGATAWVAELRRLGLHVLLNEHVVLDHDGKTLLVAGVTDYGAEQFDPAQRSDPTAALAGAPPVAGPKVLLAHQPRSAPAAAAAGFDLQLSGHTHGGQFWPWNLFVRFQQPYTAGLHRLNQLWVYTSRGTGYWGPPKRFGAPSEITRLRLVAA
ncbi:metallophosphoesterase [Andreprevotia chitinilytica]|uniref:metallophosphoesterase n=1 Tax=Andreprevotia chitinilytica TaxID=396808 RepID=UPI00054F7398|nr:metallophosphoesterase [Andreprevotia chitinilytica]